MRNRIAAIIAFVLCLPAMKICSNLLAIHVTGSSGVAWFDDACAADTGSEKTSPCRQVLNSRYSYLPPRPADGQQPSVKLPAAFVGLVYYLSIAIWMIGVGSPSYDKRKLHLLPMTFVTVGILASGWFVYVMATRIGEWCTWCAATHALNVLIAAAVVLAWPKKRRQPESGPGPQSYPHPRTRTVVITIIAILLGIYGQFYMLATKNWRTAAEKYDRQIKQYQVALKRFTERPQILLRAWELNSVCDMPHTKRDIVRHAPRENLAAWKLVVFSDFECRQCRKTALRLEEEILPLFDRRLMIVFKHFPLHRDCNNHTGSTLHPNSCNAARIAEAARIVGGPDAFWKAHDELFRRQEELKSGALSASDLAVSIGLDPDQFLETMQTTEVTEAISTDTALGATCGIPATPGVYLQGKLVDSIANRNMAFWNAIAEHFWTEIGEPRPPETQWSPQPDTPDQPRD